MFLSKVPVIAPTKEIHKPKTLVYVLLSAGLLNDDDVGWEWLVSVNKHDADKP